MKKRIINISLWTLFSVGVLLMMSFVSGRQSSLKTKSDKVSINIKYAGSNAFLTPEIVKEAVSIKLGYDIDSMSLDKIDLGMLEYQIKRLPEVKAVEVYRSVEGVLYMDITERMPIVRVIHQNGMSNYIDEEGSYMGLSNQFSAHLPVVTGHFNESDFRLGIHDIAIKDDLLFDDIYKMATFIHNSEFWSAQVLEIYINKDKEFELVPRIGEHRIIFGAPVNVLRKFKKLEIFYREGLNNTGWNQFDTINIKYKNQIVCS